MIYMNGLIAYRIWSKKSEITNKKIKTEEELRQAKHIRSILQTSKNEIYINIEMCVFVCLLSVDFGFRFECIFVIALCIFVINFSHDMFSMQWLNAYMLLYLLCIYSIFNNMSLNSECFLLFLNY